MKNELVPRLHVGEEIAAESRTGRTGGRRNISVVKMFRGRVRYKISLPSSEYKGWWTNAL